MDKALSFFSKYTIKARLLPAILAILPLLFLCSSYVNFNEDFLSNAVVVLLASLLSIFLLSNWARSAGKRTEENLLKIWKVFPTTQLMRFSDNSISPIEKAEIHRVLQNKFQMILPNKIEEENDPTSADDTYTLAINKVREHTRNDDILLNDNIYYGFMRNSLGIKKIALLLCLLTWLILGALFYIKFPYDKYSFQSLIEFSNSVRMSIWISLFFSLLMPIYWCFFITKKSIRNAALRYANRVLILIQSL